MYTPYMVVVIWRLAAQMKISNSKNKNKINQKTYSMPIHKTDKRELFIHFFSCMAYTYLWVQTIESRPVKIYAHITLNVQKNILEIYVNSWQSGSKPVVQHLCAFGDHWNEFFFLLLIQSFLQIKIVCIKYWIVHIYILNAANVLYSIQCSFRTRMHMQMK